MRCWLFLAFAALAAISAALRCTQLQASNFKLLRDLRHGSGWLASGLQRSNRSYGLRIPAKLSARKEARIAEQAAIGWRARNKLRRVSETQISDMSEISGHSMSRSLKVAAANATDVALVRTPEELIYAVEAGVRHIEVVEHLDLTSVTPLDNEDLKRMLISGPNYYHPLWSIRGNCTSDPTTALKNASRLSLTNVRQGSCVIVTDVRFLEVYQNLWLDSLHFSHVNTRRTDTSAVLWCGSQACNLWITNVTFQGQGRNDPPNGALAVSGGQVYAEGLSVVGFQSEANAVWVGDGATVTLNACNISNNNITSLFHNSGVLSVNAVQTKGITAVDQDTILKLQECSFSENIPEVPVVVHDWGNFSNYEALVFSNVDRDVLYSSEGGTLGTSEPLSETPGDRPGISGDSPWLINARESADMALAALLHPSDIDHNLTAAPKESGRFQKDSILAGVFIAVVIVAVVVCVAPVVLARNRASRAAAPEPVVPAAKAAVHDSGDSFDESDEPGTPLTPTYQLTPAGSGVETSPYQSPSPSPSHKLSPRFPPRTPRGTPPTSRRSSRSNSMSRNTDCSVPARHASPRHFWNITGIAGFPGFSGFRGLSASSTPSTPAPQSTPHSPQDFPSPYIGSNIGSISTSQRNMSLPHSIQHDMPLDTEFGSSRLYSTVNSHGAFAAEEAAQRGDTQGADTIYYSMHGVQEYEQL